MAQITWPNKVDTTTPSTTNWTGTEINDWKAKFNALDTTVAGLGGTTDTIIFDDFIGANSDGSTFFRLGSASSGANFGGATRGFDVRGVQGMYTQSSATGRSYIITQSNGFALFSHTYTVEFKIYTPVASSTAETYSIIMGALSADTGTLGTNHQYAAAIRYDFDGTSAKVDSADPITASATWKIFNSKGSGAVGVDKTYVDTGVAYAASTAFDTYKLVLNASGATWTKNGVAMGALSASTLPVSGASGSNTTLFGFGIILQKSAGTSGRTIDVDSIKITITN